jgi:hypothetical protein
MMGSAPMTVHRLLKGTAVAIQDRFSVRNLYLYLVCLVTLVISIFATVNVVRSAVELLYPDPGYYGFEAPGKESGLSAEEQRQRVQAARDSQRRQAVLGLVGSGTLLLIAGPVYVYHWRRVQHELRSRSPQPAEGQAPST